MIPGVLEAAARRLIHATGSLDTTAAYITMFDDVTVSLLPSGAGYAYLAYTDGLWPTLAAVKAKFPGHSILDMTVTSKSNATGLDIETGDATIADAPGWFHRQTAYRPVLYIQASNMKALEQEMTASGIGRASYRLLTAHYTKSHLCSPSTCGYGLSQADGTQFTQTALGRSLDQSILLPGFFDPRPAPAPQPTWQEAMMNALPTLKEGAKDTPGKIYFVGRMQSLMKYIGTTNKITAAANLTVDGDFGPATTTALLAVQAFYGLHASAESVNHECGPSTWTYLVAG